MSDERAAGDAAPPDGAPKKGTLYVVATPIGNLDDMTLRAIKVLKEVPVIAAEDTRAAQNLLRHFEIARPTIVSFFEGNEAGRTEHLKHDERLLNRVHVNIFRTSSNDTLPRNDNSISPAMS